MRLHLDQLEGHGDRELWVLRDDELGGFWGTKFRKYASITQHCLDHKISHIVATGGLNSNNLAAAAALCKEKGLHVTVFAVDDHSDESRQPTGNHFLLKLLLSADDLKVIPRSEKSNISRLMQEHASVLTSQGKQVLILEEGGGCLAAVEGCLTLADDILRDRKEWPHGTYPDHIFIDSGTALSAASLAAGLFSKGFFPKIKIHIVQMAGFEEQVIEAFSKWVTPVTGVTWDNVKDHVRVYRPLSPRSYGSTSAELFSFIKIMAQNHGLLLDPIYSAKLFMRAFDLILGQNCRGKILIIHTGGISGLMGFPQIASE
jgi:1-aminocyclopropane-1-carboxylate deaminase/D-cysteine desulfhydrase-like pyridoxal-dependent ACC family enzyme